MNIIRGGTTQIFPAAMPLRLTMMHDRSLGGKKFETEKKVNEIISLLTSNHGSREMIRDIGVMIGANIVPLTSEEVRKHPAAHVVNENDFILQCIKIGNRRMIENLSEYGFDPIPEQLIPQKLSDRSWSMLASCRPDPFLYSIFRNRMDLAKTLLESGRYELNETYCFPFSVVWRPSSQEIPHRVTCNLEVSPLTVALMQSGTIVQTKENVSTLLKLGAKKEIPPFKDVDNYKCDEDNRVQQNHKIRLEQCRLGYETFLKKCF
jgi:hypothetical protein